MMFYVISFEFNFAKIGIFSELTTYLLKKIKPPDN